jgi:hypothetical protein
MKGKKEDEEISCKIKTEDKLPVSEIQAYNPSTCMLILHIFD